MCFHSSQINLSVYFATNGSVYFVTTMCKIYVNFLIFLSHTQKQHWRSYVRGDFSYSPVKNRFMDEIDENTFMDISKIELTNAEIMTTDSAKSSIDSAMILSDTTRDGSSDNTNADATSNSIPKTFSSHLDKHGKLDKEIRKPESEKVCKSDNKSDKDAEKETLLQREISCDSVLGESKTKLNTGDKAVEDKTRTAGNSKSDRLESSESVEAIKNNDRDRGGKAGTNLVNSGEPQCQRKGVQVDEKPDIIGRDAPTEVEKHEQRLKSRQTIQDKDKKPKRSKTKCTDQLGMKNLTNVSSNVRNKPDEKIEQISPGKSQLKSDQPDLLGKCIKIEATKCDSDNNNLMKDKENHYENIGGTNNPFVACDRNSDGQKMLEGGEKSTEMVAEPCSHENCTACLSGTTGRFVLPPPPRDRRVSARPGMPSIAEDGIVWNRCGEDSCDSGEDVFDSSTTSSTYKASLDSISITSSTSSGAMGGVSSSGSCSSGEENSSPSPQAKSSMSRTTSDSGVETSPPATSEDAVSNGSTEARSLLDAMHKRYYPTMYHQKKRTHSDGTAEISSHSSTECVSAPKPCSGEERCNHTENSNVPHSKSVTFPTQLAAVTRPTVNKGRIVALDRLSDSAIQAKIDAMLTHPSQRIFSACGKGEKSHSGQTSPKLKHKPKADLTCSLSNPLSVLKSFSFTGITSPRPKHKSFKQKTPQKNNPLASLSPTFRRKKLAQHEERTLKDLQFAEENVEEDLQDTNEEDEEEDEMPAELCQTCIFIQVCTSIFLPEYVCSLKSVKRAYSLCCNL